MHGILELDIVSGSGVIHGTPDFDSLSERSNYRRESQSTIAGPPSCASVAMRRRLQPCQIHKERGRPQWLIRSGCGLRFWVRIPSDVCHRGCAYTVLQTVQRHAVYSDVYGRLQCTIKNSSSHSIRVGHISDFGLPYVAILP